MGFGSSNETRHKSICFHCKKEKAGGKMGLSSGAGFGATTRQVQIQICINHNCPEGEKNLASKN